MVPVDVSECPPGVARVSAPAVGVPLPGGGAGRVRGRRAEQPVAMESNADKLLVATDESRAFLRLIGRGTYKLGPVLKDFAATAVRKGCSLFVMDMEQCAGMDSTFMGVLAGLALRVKRETGGRVAVVHVSPKNLALLTTLGVSRILGLGEAPAGAGATGPGAATPGDMQALAAGEVDRRQLTQTMLEAHESLVGIRPENLPKFRDVIAYLSESLRSGEAGEGPAP